MSHESIKVYMGDTGITILLNCGMDLTGSTVTQIKMKKPDNSEHIFTASIQDLKYLKYVTAPQDFGYHEIDINVFLLDNTNLLTDTIYKFKLNNETITFNTNGMITPISFSDLIILLNTTLSTYNIIVSLVGNDLRFTSSVLGADVIIDHEEENDLFESLYNFTNFKEPVKAFLGDFNQYGKFFVQAYIEKDTWKGHGETAIIEVYKKFN